MDSQPSICSSRTAFGRSSPRGRSCRSTSPTDTGRRAAGLTLRLVEAVRRGLDIERQQDCPFMWLTQTNKGASEVCEAVVSLMSAATSCTRRRACPSTLIGHERFLLRRLHFSLRVHVYNGRTPSEEAQAGSTEQQEVADENVAGHPSGLRLTTSSAARSPSQNPNVVKRAFICESLGSVACASNTHVSGGTRATCPRDRPTFQGLGNAPRP